MKVLIKDKDNNYQVHELLDIPFNKGGEANLFDFNDNSLYQNKFIAKIYNNPSDTKEKKLVFQINNPINKINEENNYEIIWPQNIIYDLDKKFIGLLIKKVKGVSLEILSTGKIPKKHREEWSEFDFLNNDSLKKRLKICFNLASAVNALHKSLNYVFIDLKPDNILVNKNANIFFVDADSVEILHKGKTIFDAPVSTLEYSPTEKYNEESIVDPTQEVFWDRFSLAVILYKLLTGIHPFSSSTKGKYNDFNTIELKIQAGLFVHNENKSEYFSKIPKSHNNFFLLPKEIQILFRRCFEDGHNNPEKRPSAEEWSDTLLSNSDKLDLTTFQTIPRKIKTSNNNIQELKRIKLPDYNSQISSIQSKIYLEKSKIEQMPNKNSEKNIASKIKNRRFFFYNTALLITVLSLSVYILTNPFIAITVFLTLIYFLNHYLYRQSNDSERDISIGKMISSNEEIFNDLLYKVTQIEQKINTNISSLLETINIFNNNNINELIILGNEIEEYIINFQDYLKSYKKEYDNLVISRTEKLEKCKENYANYLASKFKNINVKDFNTAFYLLFRKNNFEVNPTTDATFDEIHSAYLKYEIEREDILKKYSFKLSVVIEKVQLKLKEINDKINTYNSLVSSKNYDFDKELSNFHNKKIELNKLLDEVNIENDNLESQGQILIENIQKKKDLNTSSPSKHFLKLLGIRK